MMVTVRRLDLPAIYTHQESNILEFRLEGTWKFILSFLIVSMRPLNLKEDPSLKSETNDS